jgi:creatinine amidohydrolase/Fe(II)-dependent formamide hydrolase-like protein
MRKTLSSVTVLALSATTVLPLAAQGRGNMTAEERARRQAEADRALQEQLTAERPIDAYDSVWIEELTWIEVRDAIAAGSTTAIIATGGIEQNGHYLATGKHNYVLQGACEGIARKLGNALCAPIIKLVPEGTIDPPSGHMRFPGTISLREGTFRAVLEDVASSLKAHGFEHIVFIGDSGGNQAGMEAVANLLNERWGTNAAHFIPEFYRYADVFEFMKTELGIEEPLNDGTHDDFVITSIMLANDPTTVRWQQRVDRGLATINGLSIEDREKTAGIGRRLLQYRVDTTVEAIRKAVAGR